MTVDREPCACGQPTPVGKWRCVECQRRIDGKPTLRLVPQLRDRPVQ
jgi:hypothetical protein